MFCYKCGTQLPNEAEFCWKCGKPQTAQSQGDEPRWETCEIVWQKGFVVEAIGPAGKYSPAEAAITSGSQSNDLDVSEHRALVSRLTEEGWEPTGDRGEGWWNNRFRRRVSEKTGQSYAAWVKLLQDFKAAREDCGKLPWIKKSDEKISLELMALVWQAFQGDVRGSRPTGFFASIEKARYDAWAKLKGMSQQAAMLAYIQRVDKLKR